MRPVLLDVNALIALFDAAHAHHEPAHRWLAELQGRAWRTCPITENGLIRILSNPSYPNGFVSVMELAGMLERTKQRVQGHDFWADSFSMSAWMDGNKHEMASSKVTDAYLLKLAALNGGTLATFDLGIKPQLIGENDPDLVEPIPI
jgi:uncharacterized protein